MNTVFEMNVAPRRGGWGVRLFKKHCAAVWAGMGWKEGEDVPKGATATMLDGFTWEDRRDAEQYVRDITFQQRASIDIHAEAMAAGLEISNWQSDLYIKVTPEATKLIESYKERVGKAHCNVSSFRSDVDGARWYEIPFAFTPFWKKRSER